MPATREVEERVHVVGQSWLRLVRCRGELLFSLLRADVEVDPPHRRRENEAEDGGSDHAAADRVASDGHADGEDRFARGDDDYLAVTFAELTGRLQALAAAATNQDNDVVGGLRQHPQHRLSAVVDRARSEDQCVTDEDC